MKTTSFYIKSKSDFNSCKERIVALSIFLESDRLLSILLEKAIAVEFVLSSRVCILVLNIFIKYLIVINLVVLLGYEFYVISKRILNCLNSNITVSLLKILFRIHSLSSDIFVCFDFVTFITASAC